MFYLEERSREIITENVNATKEMRANIEKQRVLSKEQMAQSEYYKICAKRIFENMNAINAACDKIRSDKKASESDAAAVSGLDIKSIDRKEKKFMGEFQ